jgi:hypothetical protein
MFDFLKRLRGVPEAVKESKRDRFTRLVEELNAAIAELPEKPAITVTPGTGALSFDLPEQFPDEALALPKPDVALGSEDTGEDEATGESPKEAQAKAA